MTDAPRPSGIARAAAQAGSITALARAMGVTHQAASRWHCKGFAPVKQAVKISQTYGSPVKELMDPLLLFLATENEPVA